MNIKLGVSKDIVKKIFGKKDNATLFLDAVGVATSSRISADEAYDLIVSHWNYQRVLSFTRDVFTKTKKYQQGKGAYDAMNYLLGEWEKMGFQRVAWPFSQGDFDGFVQRINAEKSDGTMKDDKVRDAAVRYRRIKEINTLRNDFIETFIFEKNKNIIPTLSHRRGVDFFIDGEQFDQKVSASPTNQFIQKFGRGESYVRSDLFLAKDQDRDDQWKQVAIENPGLVAQYLYTYQDEGRFGADPRLFIVYIDEGIAAKRIQEIINATDLTHPMDVRFEYRHKDLGVKEYTTKCFVILLYN